MGLFGFILGVGKSREEKMAIWILEHTQKHIANMIRRSNEYWEACSQFPGRKAELDSMAGAAFITHFFICLIQEVGEKWQELYMGFAFHTSSNMRNLIEQCLKSIPSSDGGANAIDIDASRFGCAKWLYSEMRIKGFISMASMGGLQMHMGQHEFTNVFMDECLAVRAEVVPFKTKFLQ